MEVIKRIEQEYNNWVNEVRKLKTKLDIAEAKRDSFKEDLYLLRKNQQQVRL